MSSGTEEALFYYYNKIQITNLTDLPGGPGLPRAPGLPDSPLGGRVCSKDKWTFLQKTALLPCQALEDGFVNSRPWLDNQSRAHWRRICYHRFVLLRLINTFLKIVSKLVRQYVLTYESKYSTRAFPEGNTHYSWLASNLIENKKKIM